MLGHIYYFFGLILFLINISIVSKFGTIYKIKEWVIKFKKVTSREPSQKEYKDKDFQYFSSYASISIMNFLWMFFGLITKSWYVFSFTIIINICVNLFTKHIGEFTIIGRILQLLKAIFTSLIIGFLVINHFHLHLDIYKMITQ
jgi:hypothetical protein